MTTRTPRVWISGPVENEKCGVSLSELETATAAARKDVMRGVRPVPEGTVPHLIITIGSPGAGKSAIASRVAAKLSTKLKGSKALAYVAKNYVTIDFDCTMKYHPRYHGMWLAQNDATGKPTDVGMTTTWSDCVTNLEETLEVVVHELLTARDVPRYNIILQTHAHERLIHARDFGYRTTLIYVGLPLGEAIKRCRTRAIDTGKFLEPTLRLQDIAVTSTWDYYKNMATWYGLWADEFIVVDNGTPATKHQNVGRVADKAAMSAKFVKLHGPNWGSLQIKAQKLIHEISGHTPEEVKGMMRFAEDREAKMRGT